jgi:glycosyltransferase involved in cell wall biosynthesis
MLTPYLPYPPASGGQIRTLNLLKYLSKNHKITLISLYKNAKEKQYASQLESYCEHIYVCKRAEKPWQVNIIAQAVLTPNPLLIVRNFSEEAHTLIRNLLKIQTFDVIHAETFYIMPHIGETDIPILLVEQTIEYKVYQHFVNKLPLPVRPFLYSDIIKLKYWETYYWKKATVVGTVSEFDRQMIQTLTPQISPVVIPNGAGDEMFVDKVIDKDLSHPKLLFMGNFFWLQNVEAANFIINSLMPELKKRFRKIKIIIAGQNAKDKLTNTSDENLEIITIGQEDEKLVKKLYYDSTLFIAPIYGPGGTRLKILAAMAAGLPIISTQVGVEGLAVENRKHVLVANTVDDFIEQITVALNDKKLVDNMQKNAYKLVKDSYSWSAIAKKLEVVYRSIRKNNENRY